MTATLLISKKPASRPMRAAVVVLLVVWAAPFSMAQTPSDAFEITDPTGDVSVLVAERTGVQAGVADPADLVALRIREDDQTIHFEVQVVGLGTDVVGTTPDAARLDVRFRHGLMRYDIGTGIEMTGEPFAELRKAYPGQTEEYVDVLPFDADGAGLFTVHVERGLLADQNGTPPQPGRAFTDLRVDSHVHATGVFLVNPDGSLMQPIGIRDRLPDGDTTTYEIRLGGPETVGAMKLEVPVPFRASNGGEAALLYPFTVSNLDDTDRTFLVTVRGAPAGWTVEGPGSLTVAPGAARDAAVLVRTPFGHQHGGKDTVTFVVAREDGTAWARAEIGILYLDIPQPAGHHDSLWIQGTEGPGSSFAGPAGIQDGLAFMNADPEIADNATAVGGEAWNPLLDPFIRPDPLASTWKWAACLQPSLVLGLDFDLARTGTLNVIFSGARPGAAALTGQLVLVSDAELAGGCSVLDVMESEWTVLAELGATPAQETSGGAAYEATLTPLGAADYVPYAPGRNLVLVLSLEYDTPFVLGVGRPLMEPGGTLRLPLDEYFDEGPAGLIGGDGIPIVRPGSLGGDVAPPPAEEAGVLPLPMLLAGLAVAAVARRR